MPGIENMWAGPVTETGTTKQHPLGTQRLVNHATYGLGTWIYIQVSAASAALAKGSSVAQDAASADPFVTELTPANADPTRVRGVADHVIAAASYGWIIKEGRCELLSNGTTTADTAQKPSSTAGQWVDTGGVTAASNAWAYETESPGGAGNLAGGYISC